VPDAQMNGLKMWEGCGDGFQGMHSGSTRNRFAGGTRARISEKRIPLIRSDEASINLPAAFGLGLALVG
jgi:hypothetical protein